MADCTSNPPKSPRTRNQIERQSFKRVARPEVPLRAKAAAVVNQSDFAKTFVGRLFFENTVLLLLMSEAVAHGVTALRMEEAGLLPEPFMNVCVVLLA